MRILRVILLLGACLHLTGGHWGVLQCVAWTKMLVDYSTQDGLIEGARKTFDGEHPCCMCKSIAEGRKSERDQQLPTSAKHGLSLKEVTLPSRILLRTPVAPRSENHVFVSPRLAVDLWAASPPSPPPRRLAS